MKLAHIFYTQRFTILSLFIVLLMFMMTAFVLEANKVATERKLSGSGYKGQANLGGPFTLTDHNGQVFTEQNLLGKYSLIFFGFTFCPDICPLTLSNVAEVYDRLAPEQQEKLQVLFVSIDPQRDVATALTEYVTAFHPEFIGLSGTDTQTAQITDAYKVYYAKLENAQKPTDYLMDHSGFLYLMGPDGEYAAHFSHKTPINNMLEQLQMLLKS